MICIPSPAKYILTQDTEFKTTTNILEKRGYFKNNGKFLIGKGTVFTFRKDTKFDLSYQHSDLYMMARKEDNPTSDFRDVSIKIERNTEYPLEKMI